MKKTILSLAGMVAVSLSLMAQNKPFDTSNAREGENVEYCQTHKKMAEKMKDPAVAAAIALATSDPHAHTSEPAINKATVYKIPVVFHVLHNNGIENISEAQILDALNILNRDYRALNVDAATVQPEFSSLVADAEIEFVLATKAPNGTCFKGITRTVNTLTFNGSNGDAQVNAIKNGNDVYQGEWAGNKYLNIFICAEIGGAAGYTYNPIPGWTTMNTGIWILHEYVGAIGTSSTYSSRALTHEVGHWLNLSHTWGGNNNPGNASSCSSDDGVSDTPNTIGVTSCNLNEATCGPKANVENYMDYSYCSKMFTEGQKTRMRNALNSSTGGRNNVIASANLISTGADGNTYLCKAEFSADKTTICAGDQVQFTDGSYNEVSGWNWTFTGGSPASSIGQNPTVTYATPGIYQVVLSATDGSNNDTETKTAYIRVLSESAQLPFLDGFETYSTLTNIDEWEVKNNGNNAKFDITTSASHTGSKSVKLANYGQAAGNIDELISAPVDLTSIGTGTVSLSFRYAYRKRSSSNNEYLKVYVTNNCGETWAVRKTIFGNFLSSEVSTSSWTPSSQSDWTTVHMTNITSSYFVENFRYKFEFDSDGGNNFYLDNINIYNGSPSEELIAGLESLNNEVEGFSVYPNPVMNELNVRFSLTDAQKTVLTIQDISGKVVHSNLINANAGSNLVMMDANLLAPGVYFLKISAGGSQEVIQFVVK